ncbi:MAG: OmpA family protein, partial [Propylenella sp.]
PPAPEPQPAPDQPPAETAPEAPAAAPDLPPQGVAPEAPPEGSALERAQQRREELRRRQQGAPETEPTEQVGAEPPPAGTETPVDTIVEEQLEAQGDDEEANRVRNLREQLLEQLQEAVGIPATGETVVEPAAPGEARDRRRPRRSEGVYRRDPDQGEVVERRGGRLIIDLGGGNIFVRPDVPDEGGRLLYGADDVEVQELRGGRTRTIVYRRNGVQIVTIRDRYGEIIRRTKVLPDGREIVLIDNRFDDDDRRRPVIIRDVRPPRVRIPRDEYIVDLGRASREDIRATLLAPPVDEIERPYTLDEVLRNEQVRAYSPRIDLDTITFEFGSFTIGVDQMDTLFALGEVMEEIIAENPDEVYLIEGHTDLVGTDNDNLILSDLRAEAVAVALSQNFDIPPENLVTEGYGEQYPKVPTEGPERLNRRAAVVRLTDLMAQN